MRQRTRRTATGLLARLVPAVALIAGLVVGIPTAAEADTIVVTSTADDLGADTLRLAVVEASLRPGPDTIQLLPGATYELTACAYGGLLSTDELTIEGRGSTIAQRCTVFDGYQNVLSHLSSRPLTINDTSMIGRYAFLGGVLLVRGPPDPYLDAPRVTLARSQIRNGFAHWGGGLFAAGDVVMTSTIVAGNVAVDAFVPTGPGTGETFDATGGGIFVAGSLTADTSSIVGNEANFAEFGGHGTAVGGGIAAQGAVTLRNTTVAANLANAAFDDGDWRCDPERYRCDALGGGVAAVGPVSVTGGVVSDNVAGASSRAHGGGIRASSAAPMNLEGVDLRDNAAYALAGAGDEPVGVEAIVDRLGADEALRRPTGDGPPGPRTRLSGPPIVSFDPGDGPGIANDQGDVVACDAPGAPPCGAFGGGVDAAGEVSVSSGTVTGNRAQAPGHSEGGGIRSTAPSAPVTLTGVDVHTNVASARTSDGGGVRATSVSVHDAQIASNQATHGGAIHVDGRSASLRVVSSVLDENRANFGGAVWGQGTLALESATVSDNVAADRAGTSQVEGTGGGVHWTGRVDASDSTIIHNQAVLGGGIAIQANVEVGEPEAHLTRTTIAGNEAQTFYGGLAAFGVKLDITDSVISANQADEGGGIGTEARAAAGAPEAYLTRTTIADNRTRALSGGIAAHDVALEVTDSTISGNRAETSFGGGAALGPMGSATFRRARILRNHAGDPETCPPTPEVPCGFGGGFTGESEIAVLDSEVGLNSATVSFGSVTSFNSVLVVNSHVHHNDAGSFAGIGALEDGTEIRVVGSLVEANRATRFGGGISTGVGATATIVNSTVTGNSAGERAGGIAALGPVNVQFSTVTGNQSPRGANLAATKQTDASPDLPVDILGSVFASPSGGGENCEVYDGRVTARHAYATDDSCDLAGPTNTDGGFDPLLAPLAANGGPTLTMQPAAGSPLIDAVPPEAAGADGQTCAGLARDQRDVVRPEGSSCDIGAVELRLLVVDGAALATEDVTPVSIDVLSLTSDPDDVLRPEVVGVTGAPRTLGPDAPVARLARVEGGTAVIEGTTVTYTATPGLTGQGWFLVSVCAPGGTLCSTEALVTVDVTAVTSAAVDPPAPAPAPAPRQEAQPAATTGDVVLPRFTG